MITINNLQLCSYVMIQSYQHNVTLSLNTAHIVDDGLKALYGVSYALDYFIPVYNSDKMRAVTLSCRSFARGITRHCVKQDNLFTK